MNLEYDDLNEALTMLDKDCDPLKFEVFVTYTNMVANGALTDHKPQDVMLHAMMEWDLS